MGEGFKGENLSVHMMMNVTTFKDALWCSETARTFATCYIPFPCASSTWPMNLEGLCYDCWSCHKISKNDPVLDEPYRDMSTDSMQKDEEVHSDMKHLMLRP
ncbi:hypothetical protein CCMA1212_008915 [Trichoderma ghanense]|uniref:Uncharacterized protein n=1 Tax=Trichoderma ghanense TaxID=65468 RepID=A0ABY2GTV5_9HYPO